MPIGCLCSRAAELPDQPNADGGFEIPPRRAPALLDR